VQITNGAAEAQPVVTLTECAAREVAAKLAGDPQGAGKGLRLYVEREAVPACNTAWSLMKTPR